MGRFTTMMVALLLVVTTVGAEILVDGRTADWRSVQPVVIDPIGDGESGSVDFDSLWVKEEYGFLLIRVRLNEEVLMQDGSGVDLLIDRDNDPETGEPLFGMGVDIEWQFGLRNGTLHLDGNDHNLNQAEWRIVSAPTVSATEFEISVDLSSRFDGDLLLPAGDIRLALWDGGHDGDIVPNSGGLLFTLPSGDPGTPDVLTLEHYGTRFVTWNILFDGLTERPNDYRQILQAIQPDIIVFEEMWDSDADDAVELLDVWMPLENGWNGSKEGGDIVLATRYPILGSWDIPEARATAFLIQPDDFPADLPMLVIGAHPPCCANNEARQWEMDAFMSWLREAMQGNGPAAIPDLFATVVTGDMNLVGWDEQLRTLVEGEIINTSEFGESFHPDFDGTPLYNAYPRHFLQNQVYTWRDDGSSFTPGKLDYIVFSDYLLNAENMFVFDTRTMPMDILEAHGLTREANAEASDHMPVVADFSVVINNAPESENEPPQQSWLDWKVSPNPTNAGVSIVVDLEKGVEGKLAVYDVLGRWVADLQVGPIAEGRTTFSWDGRDQHGIPVGSGQYFFRLEGDGRMATRRVTVIQ